MKSNAPFSKEEEEIPRPDFREVGLGKPFAGKVIKYRMLQEQIKALEEERKEIGDSLGALLVTQGVKSVLCDGNTVTLVDTTRSSLSKEKLLENGVSAAQISAATTVSQSTYVKVTAPPKSI